MTLMRSTLLAAALSLAAGSAFSGDVTTARNSVALSPKAATRSMTESGSADEAAVFVDTLRNRGTRSLWVAERDRVAVIAADRPTADLVTAGYGSSRLKDRANGGQPARSSRQIVGLARLADGVEIGALHGRRARGAQPRVANDPLHILRRRHRA